MGCDSRPGGGGGGTTHSVDRWKHRCVFGVHIADQSCQCCNSGHHGNWKNNA